MKRILILLIALLCSILAFSQKTINRTKTKPAKQPEIQFSTQGVSAPTGLLMLDLKKIENAGRTLSEKDTAIINNYCLKLIDGQYFVGAFITTDGNCKRSDLEALGVKVNIELSTMVVGLVPIYNLEAVAALPFVKQVGIGTKAEPQLDEVRVETGAALIEQGTGLNEWPITTGEGVVVGIIDGGFDYTHPNFYNSDFTASRIKRVWEQTKQGTPPEGFDFGRELTTYEQMRNAGTDNQNGSHGTHVAGIAAGRGVNAEVFDSYRGIAPDSDIVLVATGWTDYDIIYGIAYIANYAFSVGKPCVINMSLGNHIGPHDGTSDFDRACDQMLEELLPEGCILVGAAGNSGANRIHLDYNFSSSNNYMTTFCDMAASGSDVTNIIDIWGEPNKNFQVNVEIINTNTGEIESSTEWHSTANSENIVYTLWDDDIFSTADYCIADIVVEINPNNNKPHAQLNITTNQDDSYRKVAIRVYATSGRIDMWSNSNCNFTSSGYTDCTDGDTFYTICEVGGTGKSMISVGAYTTKNSYSTIDGDYVHADFYETIGDITSFSSKGSTVDGRVKPNICAPGNVIMSSVNHYDSNYGSGNNTVHGMMHNSSFYYYGAMQGTSQAAPVVTGSIALWLSLCPNLTVSQVKDLLYSNAIRDSYVTSGTVDEWGYGKLHTYAGYLDLYDLLPYLPTINDEYGFVEYLCPGSYVLLSAPEGYEEYLWSNGETTRSIQAYEDGDYYVRVKNENGYWSNWSYPTEVIESPAPAAAISASGHLDCSNQPVTLTAAGGEWYDWRNGPGESVYTVSAPGTYTVTVTSLEECTSTASITITANTTPPAVSVTSQNTVLSCANPQVTLTANGGNSYLWSGGETTNSISTQTAGNYTVTVTGTNSCTATSSAVVYENFATPVVQILGLDEICANTTTSLTATGGNVYAWNNGQTGSEISVSNVGTYTVTVTGGNGCTATASHNLAIIPAPNVQINTDNYFITCNNPSIILTAIGGGNYLWNNGLTTNSITISQAGTYSVTATNENNCQANTSVVIGADNAQPNAIINANSTVITCSNPEVTLSANGGNSYSWNNGQNQSSITTSTPGNYVVSVTSENGCSATTGVNITEDRLLPTVSIIGETSTCVNVPINLTAVGGVSYIWSNGETTNSILVSSSDIYTVTATATNGCTATANHSIIANTPPEIPFITQNGNMLITNNCTHYQWYLNGIEIPNATGQFYVPQESGEYSVTITNQFGCSSSSEIYTYTIPTSVDLQISDFSIYPNPANTSINIEASKIESVTVTNVIGQIVEILHYDGESQATIDVANFAEGTYFVKVKCANGQKFTEMIEVMR